MCIILCGLPCSGKTTCGKALAKQLCWTFIDTDQMMEARLNLPCREIYKKKGNAFFRAFEKEQIATLMGLQRHVIAVGGGCLEDPENGQVLRALGCVVYLKIDPEVVWERMQKRGLPPFLKGRAEFDKMVEKRCSHYEQIAHMVKEIDGK